ncbi:uncharacterized protein LOC129595760 [Paramacrobiotus metropolitanus]|uniref:uncharacterized protein LOC129595760 n=1 Tax=Paramacrobiotus metropolitanus TaxID=2943436 RepID=UPI0024456348|nr:uncharacterized protein LOC129595760 [Paramacrobiotus metropolitanus]
MAGNLYRPNSIDIVGADGLVRYGRVVDVTDNGFFVDFLCPSRRRRFFPFDSSVFPSDIRRVFRQDIVADAWAASQAPSPARVEVLMRESPSGPWTWFPAEIVHPPRIADGPHRHYHVVVVRWDTCIHGVMQSDVVPVERIRLPMPVARWASAKRRRSEVMPNELQIAAQRVGKWTFVKRSVKLPDNVAWMSVNELRRLWHSNDDVVNYRPITFVEVRNGCSYYLERSFAHQWYEQMDGTFHPEFPETIRKFHNQFIERLPRIIGTPLINTTEVRDVFPLLPPELLLEVFSHVNTMTQTKLRAVCLTWDYILQSPLLTATLLITSCESVDHPERLEYHLTAPVYKCLSAKTQNYLSCRT